MSLFFGIILFIAITYWAWHRIAENRAEGRVWYDFGSYRFFMLTLISLIVCMFIFSLADIHPSFVDPDEQIQFATRTKQPTLISKGLRKKIEQEPRNRDYHFSLIQQYYFGEQENYVVPDERQHNLEGVAIFSYYTELARSNYDSLSDLGNLFLCFWYLEKKIPDTDNAFSHLRQIKESESPYVQYAMGRAMEEAYGYNTAIPNFRAELRVKGFRAGAWQELARIYNAENQLDSLRNLVYAPESEKAIDFDLRRKIYFLDGDLKSFYALYFGEMFPTLPWLGVVAALLVLLIWISFLNRLSFLEPMSYTKLLLAAGLGAVMSVSAWLLYAFYEYILLFERNGNWGHDFMYCFLGIGLIEELVKIIPFLILLRFTNIIRRPIDYLLIAGASGLGFAFFENMLYISIYGLDVIHMRALMACVGHLIFSSIVAYGFVLWKFRWPEKWWLIPVFFLLAALAHGFYDFWLLAPGKHSLGIITFLFFLASIVVFVSLVNNALNHSTNESQKVSDFEHIPASLSGFLAGALTFIFVFEYVSICVTYGSSYGNAIIFSSLLAGGFLVFFLSIRMTNLEVIPGHWGKIKFFTSLLPASILAETQSRFRNATIGQSFIISQSRAQGLLVSSFPFSGKITRRIRLKDNRIWYEFKLVVPLQVRDQFVHDFYIRTQTPTDIIGPDQPVEIEIFIRFIEPSTGKERLVFVDWAMIQ